MATTGGNISQRIALEGAQEILKSLADIGVKGQAAFKQLQDAVQSTQPQLSSFETALNRAGASLQKFSSFSFADVGKNFSENFKIGKAFSDLEDAGGRVIKRFEEVGLGIVAAATAVTLFVKSAADSADEVKKQSEVLGLSIDAYQGLRFAAASSGIEQDRFATGMRGLAKAVSETVDVQSAALEKFNANWGLSAVVTPAAINGIGKAADALRQKMADLGVRFVTDGQNTASFNERLIAMGVRFGEVAKNAGTGTAALNVQAQALRTLGVNLFDTEGKEKSFETILGDVAEGFKRLGEGPLAVKLATDLFLKSGNELLPFLFKGKQGLGDLVEQFNKLGLGVTLTQTQIGQNLNSAFTKLSATMSGVKTQIGLIFAPALTAIIDALTSSILNNWESWKKLAQTIANEALPAVAGFIRAITGVDISKSLNLSPDQIVKANEWQATFERIGTSISEFATDVKEFFTVALPAIFEKVRPLLDAIAGGFEKLTGVHLSAEEMGLVLIGTQILGINGFVLDLIKTFGLLLIAAVAAFGTAGLVGLAVAAFAAFAAWDFAPIVAKALKAWDDIKAKWQVSPVEAGQAGVGASIDIGGDFAAKLAPALGPQGLVVSLFFQAAKAIKDNFGSIVDFFSGLPAAIGSALSGLVDIIVAPFRSASDQIITALEPVAQKVRDILSAISGINIPSGGGFGGSAEGAPFARGGFVWGPGTSTSDSILARLSRGEFVIRAAAVDHFGPGFFAALNNLRMPKFSLGGLVDELSQSFAGMMPVPRFAAGGLVPAPANSGRAMKGATFILDGRSFGLQGHADVVDALERHATMQQVASTGVKPAWRR